MRESCMLLTFGDARHRSFASSAAFIVLDSLLGTGGATINPNFYLRHGTWPGEGRQCAAFPWTPTPADKIVIRDVVE
jgi:hypothetical protein